MKDGFLLQYYSQFSYSEYFITMVSQLFINNEYLGYGLLGTLIFVSISKLAIDLLDTDKHQDDIDFDSPEYILPVR